MAQPHRKTGTWGEDEEVKAKNVALAVKEDRGVLFWKYLQEQKDPENHREEDAKREEPQKRHKIEKVLTKRPYPAIKGLMMRA